MLGFKQILLIACVILFFYYYSNPDELTKLKKLILTKAKDSYKQIKSNQK